MWFASERLFDYIINSLNCDEYGSFSGVWKSVLGGYSDLQEFVPVVLARLLP